MKKLVNLFDKSQKSQFIFLIFFMVVASFLELLGFGMVILILNTFLGLNDSYPEIVNYFFTAFQSF